MLSMLIVLVLLSLGGGKPDEGGDFAPASPPPPPPLPPLPPPSPPTLPPLPSPTPDFAPAPLLQPFKDTCNYTDYFKRCGDACISLFANCYCGYDAEEPVSSFQHCCISSDTKCTSGVCPDGIILPLSVACNKTTDRSLKCKNSYQDSQFLGIWSHYTCPNLCVPEEDMCQGVSWCDSDVEECGPQIRCSE